MKIEEDTISMILNKLELKSVHGKQSFLRLVKTFSKIEYQVMNDQKQVQKEKKKLASQSTNFLILKAHRFFLELIATFIYLLFFVYLDNNQHVKLKIDV